MKFALRPLAPSSIPSKPFAFTSFADPALQPLSFHIVTKLVGGPPSCRSFFLRFFPTLFTLSPLPRTLTEKHRGYRGLYLQTPAEEKWVPGSQGSYLRTLRCRRFRPPQDSHSGTRRRILACLHAYVPVRRALAGLCPPSVLHSSPGGTRHAQISHHR